MSDLSRTSATRKEAEMRKALMTYDEVAAYLGVNKREVQRMVHQGRIRPARFGAKTVRFRQEDVDVFVERHICSPEVVKKKDRDTPSSKTTS